MRVEIVPWLTQPFGRSDSSRLILEEVVEGPVTLRAFLVSLAGRHPAVRTAILDADTGQLAEHVNVVHNDTLLGSRDALDELVRPGDSLVFMPAFSGG